MVSTLSVKISAFFFAPVFFIRAKPFSKTRRSSLTLVSVEMLLQASTIACSSESSACASSRFSKRRITPLSVCLMAAVDELCRLNRRSARS